MEGYEVPSGIKATKHQTLGGLESSCRTLSHELLMVSQSAKEDHAVRLIMH